MAQAKAADHDAAQLQTDLAARINGISPPANSPEYTPSAPAMAALQQALADLQSVQNGGNGPNAIANAQAALQQSAAVYASDPTPGNQQIVEQIGNLITAIKEQITSSGVS